MMAKDSFDVDDAFPDPFGSAPELPELTETLAKLPPLDYELKRDAFAKEHGIRVTVLDTEVEKLRRRDLTDDEDCAFEEVTPWGDPVDGAALLEEIATQIERFCVLPDHAAPLKAAWALHARALDAADISPVLAFTSPEECCGKSTAMSVIHALSPKAEIAANITAAVLFRLIEKHKPTLLIDEADTFLEAREEMRGIINGGPNRQLAYVWRCAGDDHERFYPIAALRSAVGRYVR